MEFNASVEPKEFVETDSSVELKPLSPCSTPSYSINDNEDNALQSPSSSLKSPISPPNADYKATNQHQQMVAPRPQRDFYRFPVKVPRSAYKYEVCDIARVRAAYGMESETVTELPRGTVVTVEEIWSNRARISSPMCGWLSVYSMNGQQLLMPLDENAAKIGGHIMFKDEWKRVAYAEVIGYDHHCGLHSVMLERAGLQWVSLSDPNLRYIPQTFKNPQYIHKAKQIPISD